MLLWLSLTSFTSLFPGVWGPIPSVDLFTLFHSSITGEPKCPGYGSLGKHVTPFSTVPHPKALLPPLFTQDTLARLLCLRNFWEFQGRS